MVSFQALYKLNELVVEDTALFYFNKKAVFEPLQFLKVSVEVTLYNLCKNFGSRFTHDSDIHET